MFFTNRLELLKKDVENNIEPGGELHLCKYYLHSHFDDAINVPVTHPSKLSCYFRGLKLKLNLNPFEVLKGIEHYWFRIEDTENEIDKANRWEDFLQNTEDYSFTNAERFYNYYFNLIIGTVALRYKSNNVS